MWRNIGNDLKIKKLGLLTVGLVVAWSLVSSLFGGGAVYGSYPYYGRGMVSNANWAITPVLLLIIKLLWFVFVVSLIIGLALAAKKYIFAEKKLNLGFLEEFVPFGYECPCCGTKLGSEFNYCPACKAVVKEPCSNCGKELKINWKYCPACGETRKMND